MLLPSPWLSLTANNNTVRSFLFVNGLGCRAEIATQKNLSMLHRSALTLTFAVAILGIVTPSAAQEPAPPGGHVPAPHEDNGAPAQPGQNGQNDQNGQNGQNGMPPGSDGDDPYGPPPLMTPGNPANGDVTEPANPNEMPSDSSTTNHEANSGNVVPPPPPVAAPAQAPAPDLMNFEENVTAEPSFESTETQRDQAEALSEVGDVPNLLPPPESLPALSIVPAFRLGPATMAIGLRYEALHDNNILLSPNDRQGDFEHIISPRFSLSVGDAGYGDADLGIASQNTTLVQNTVTQKPNYLALNYDPQFLFFQHYRQYNAFEEQLRLNGQYVLPRTILRESLNYNHTTDPDRELQGRVSRDILSNDTDALYHASERIAYELEGTVLVRNFADEINSDEGRLRLWTRYAATPSWTVSVGAAGGALLPEEGTTQVFEQAWLATQNQIGTNLNVYLAVGGDFREPESTGEILVTPLVDAIIRYVPSTETEVDLTAIRQIFSSADVINENYVSTRISLTATQRLWQTYKVAAALGYENADYFQFGPQTFGPRSDNYPTAKVEFSYARFDDLEAGIFYEYRKNFSSNPDSSFLNQQVGIEFRIGNLNL